MEKLKADLLLLCPRSDCMWLLDKLVIAEIKGFGELSKNMPLFQTISCTDAIRSS